MCECLKQADTFLATSVGSGESLCSACPFKASESDLLLHALFNHLDANKLSARVVLSFLACEVCNPSSAIRLTLKLVILVLPLSKQCEYYMYEGQFKCNGTE